jgi:hypothetical protein
MTDLAPALCLARLAPSPITDEASPFAPRSTRNRPRTAVRRGASWTAAYRRQLTVAAVARPVRGGVGAPASLLLSGPGGCSPRRRLPRGASSHSRGEAETRATLPKSRWSGGSVATRAAGLGAGRGGRACLLSDQAGQAACGAPVAGGCAVGTRGRLQREVAAAAAWRSSSGWVLDHDLWSSPSLTAGWADPEGPGEVPAEMGVRPQRGPIRQRSDLPGWVVGLPGLEPGTSSLSEMDGRARC